MKLVIHGHELALHPQGAVWLAQARTLVVADVHLGKAAAFRAGGVPVPEGDAELDLQRMEALVSGTGAESLVVAGDLFHSATGVTEGILGFLEGFLRRVRVTVTLVIGNHDRKVGSFPEGLRIEEWVSCGGVRIIHDPAEAEDDRALTLCGHWHPVARIPDGRRTALRIPCFLLRGHRLVLPSFGSFTGGSIVEPEKGDRFFVTMRDDVVEVPGRVIGSR